MQIGKIDLNKEILVVAEIGNNHEGNFELAKKMISSAAEAGVQAVKFQTIVPEKLVSSDQEERLNQLRKFQFSFEQIRKLKKQCDDEGLLFLSTPFDLETVDFLNELVPAFKISSGDNTFYPLLEKVALTGKPIILSTGLTKIKAIEKSVQIIKSTWEQNQINKGSLALLHCNVSYPTPNSDVNLRAIESLKKFGCTVGYSDHSLGIDAAIFSLAFGVRIIEKHFTFDKARTTFRDHQLSADKEDLNNLIEKISLFNLMSGSAEKNITQSEKLNLDAVRRSIATARFIKKGTVIHKDDITWLRPGTGLAPGKESEILNKKLKRDYKDGIIFESNDLEG